MNRFKHEIFELGFGLYRDDQCERICALARTLGVDPAIFNSHEMGNEFYDAERDLLHFAMKQAAADSLGIEARQLSKLVRTAHALTEEFPWGTSWDNGEVYPECGPMFVSSEGGVKFVFPVFGEDNSAVYEDFPVFKYRMSSECPDTLNLDMINCLELILDVLDDESISDEVADTVFTAFIDCVGEDYVHPHPSMLDVCTRILKRSWAA